jgi:basic membrane protein A
MEDDVVKLAPLTELAPEGAEEAVEEAKEKILNDELIIFEGPIYDQEGNLKVEEGQQMTDEEMLNMMWFVEGIEGNIE